MFCELYAGGKYKNDTGENYEFSLGLNGLGTCATQYSSEYMDVTVVRDGFEYTLHFEKGENKTGTKEGFHKKPTNSKKTGTTIDLVWNLSDLFNGLMVFPNLVALIFLSGIVAKAAREDKDNLR